MTAYSRGPHLRPSLASAGGGLYFVLDTSGVVCYLTVVMYTGERNTMKAAMRVVYHDGQWEVRDGESVVRFASSTDAWDYKQARESATMRLLRRFRKAAA